MSNSILFVLIIFLAFNTLMAFVRNLPSSKSERDREFAKYVKYRAGFAVVTFAAFVFVARAPIVIGAAIVVLWLAITVGGGWLAMRRLR